MERLCAEQLSGQDQFRIDDLLDIAKGLAQERNFPAHSLIYSSGDSQFLLQKFTEKLRRRARGRQGGRPRKLQPKRAQNNPCSIKDCRSLRTGNSRAIRCVPINTLSEQGNVSRSLSLHTPNSLLNLPHVFFRRTPCTLTLGKAVSISRRSAECVFCAD